MIRKLKYIPLLIPILLLLVLPSVNFLDYPQSTVSSKFVVFVYSVLILLGYSVLVFVFSKPKNIQVSKLDITLLLFVGYITINRYFIQDNYGFSLRYFELIGLVGFYIVLRFYTVRTFIWLLFAITISGSIQAVYGNLQLFGYYPSNHSGFRLTGSFFNPGPYAGFLSAAFILILGVYFYKDVIFQRLNLKNSGLGHYKFFKSVFDNTLLIIIVSILLVIPATQSRGAWMSTLLGGLLLAELKYRYIRNSFKKIARLKKVVLISIVLSVFVVSLFGVYHFKKGSADGRLFIWKVSTKIIKDNPITGVGFDRFKVHYMNYQANYFEENGETIEALVADNSYYAFNDWLQFTVENGVIGLLLLGIIISVLFRIKVKDKDYTLLLIGKVTLLTIGVFALFSYPMHILPIKVILVFILAFLASIDRNKYVILSRYNTKPIVHWVFKMTVLALTSLGMMRNYTYVQTLDQSFKDWKMALTTYQYGDYEGAIDLYKKSYPILQKEGDFLMNYGKALTMNIQYKDAILVLKDTKKYLNTTIAETALGDAYKGMKQYDKAEIAYQHAANMIPVRFYPLYLQAKLFEESGQKDKAIVIAKIILEKDVKVPSTAIREIRAEMKNIIESEKKEINP